MDSQFPITPLAKKAIVVANKIAADNGYSYIGTEHLFLALIAEEQPGVQRIIEGCGLSPRDFRGKAADFFRACSTPSSLGTMSTETEDALTRLRNKLLALASAKTEAGCESLGDGLRLAAEIVQYELTE